MSAAAPASIKWPDVPACYGWLSLDRRGRWRLQGEPVHHPGLIDFLRHGYGRDEAGCWFVQNGPQRVFVTLDYTPWVVRLDPDGFVTQTGSVVAAAGFVIDEEGNVLVHWPDHIGLLDDRDLPAFLGSCTRPDGSPATEEDFLALMAGDAAAVLWRGRHLSPVARSAIPGRFRFNPSPSP